MFQFAPGELKRLAQEPHTAVLVCGGASPDDIGEMEVCMLKPDQLEALLGLSGVSTAQSRSVTVRREPRKSLRVSSPQVTKDFVVPRNALETWDVPGV